MKFNFRKIAAIGASVLMAGMTAGVAAAAAFPAPFVSGGSANVAVVYGTGSGVSALDVVEAGNIQSNLQSYMGSSSGSSSSVSTSGEIVSLDSNSNRIWLNSSMNTLKSVLTKSHLPTVLADYTFSGNVDSKLTQTIKIPAGETTTALSTDEHTDTVLFLKQPTSSSDPTLGISLGTSVSGYTLYNASVTMSAINFTSPDSEGQEIELFGQKFTISADTDLTSIVLLKQAEKFNLDSDNPSTTITIDGEEYIIELISASDTAATVQVTNSAGVSDSKEISEADSKKVNGVEMGVITADETNLKLSASLIAGADKMTLTSGSSVTVGDSADPIDGTYVFITGGTNATTELVVTVFAPDSSHDAILEGESLVDPVFGSFKFGFAGISSSFDDSNRETITVQNSADDTVTLTMTNGNSYTKSLDVVYNTTRGSINYKPANWTLSDSNNQSIYTYEMANLSIDDYMVVGNEEDGRLIQVTTISNNTGTDWTKDSVKFKDMFSGDYYDTTFSSECETTYLATCGTVQIGDRSYGVLFQGSGDEGWVQLKYPTTDSANAQTFVLYPTINTKNGAQMFLYEPLNISLSDFNKSGISENSTFRLPDGDGYTDVTFKHYVPSTADDGNLVWNFTTAATDGDTLTGLNTSVGITAGDDYVTATIGTLTYNFTASGGQNSTMIYLVDPEGTANIDQPAIVFFEGKDYNSAYHAIVVDLETAPGGTSTDGVGVNDVLYSSDYYHSAELTMPGDSTTSKQIDWWGTLETKDASDSDQKTVTLSYPKEQVYANIYVGAESATVTSSSSSSAATQLGDVLVKDSEVSSVATKNLIVVGGSCINSAAATLVGSPACSADFTTATGIGSGEWIIKGYADSSLTSGLALLVAGYEASDTVNAATYLRNQKPDTSGAWKGSSPTSATAVVEAA